MHRSFRSIKFLTYFFGSAKTRGMIEMHWYVGWFGLFTYVFASAKTTGMTNMTMTRGLNKTQWTIVQLYVFCLGEERTRGRCTSQSG